MNHSLLRAGSAAALLSFSLTLLALHSVTAEWPQYRGTQAGGVDDRVALPTTWDVTTGDNVRWQTPIPGMAHSSPTAWGDRIYVATAVAESPADLKVGLYGDIASANDRGPQQWRLLALDRASGKILWNT